MKWLNGILGINDKKQSEKTEEVNKLVEKKMKGFASDLKELKHEARKVHSQSQKTTNESAKLVISIADVTSAIAIASGILEKKKKNE